MKQRYNKSEHEMKREGKNLKDILKMMAGGILNAGIKGITLAKKQISYVDM